MNKKEAWTMAAIITGIVIAIATAFYLIAVYAISTSENTSAGYACERKNGTWNGERIEGRIYKTDPWSAGTSGECVDYK